MSDVSFVVRRSTLLCDRYQIFFPSFVSEWSGIFSEFAEILIRSTGCQNRKALWCRRIFCYMPYVHSRTCIHLSLFEKSDKCQSISTIRPTLLARASHRKKTLLRGRHIPRKISVSALRVCVTQSWRRFYSVRLVHLLLGIVAASRFRSNESYDHVKLITLFICNAGNESPIALEWSRSAGDRSLPSGPKLSSPSLSAMGRSGMHGRHTDGASHGAWHGGGSLFLTHEGKTLFWEYFPL